MSAKIMSSDNKHALHHTFYTPTSTTDATDDSVKATLLIVHGMAEHSGRYSEFAQFLADNGIAILAYDQLGHGRTADPDEFGYVAPKYPVQTLLKDVVIMANELKSRYPNVPHFIMGHSMGSFITRIVLQHHSHDFKGAILMGTSDTEPLIHGLLPVVNLLNKVKPKAENTLFSKATNKILNSKLHKNDSNSDYAWISNNPEGREDYENDPLCGFDFTNNGFSALFNIMKQALAKDWAYTINKDFPMLFVSGEDDPIGNMGKGIHALVERMTDEQGFTNIQKQLYENMRHEPLHEEDNQQVYSDILNWINQVVAK